MRRLALVIALGLAAAAPARGQGLPAEPISLGDGRLVIGADVTATVAPTDPGFFNYTDYEYSALRNFRLGVAVELRPSTRLQVLSEIRLDGDRLRPYAVFARIRPWPSRAFDIQLGRVPPTFGAFGHRSYGADSLLPGQPLAYQYLTSLRTDALPRTADDLLRMRGRGWLASYPAGNRAAAPGVPIVNTTRRDAGLQLHAVQGPFEWIAAVTTGTLSNPRLDDDNDGRQVAGRVVLRPGPAVAIGVSAARGAYLSRSLAGVLPTGTSVESATQRALGLDGEYSAGHFLSRAEVIWSRWDMPTLGAPAIDRPLGAVAVLGEARYRLWPGVYAAARAEHLGFSRIRGRAGLETWDAPVTRVELGGGWSPVRNVTLKASWQHNRRDGGRVRRLSLVSAQLFYWF
ncbi:MAG: hypothetical protein AB7H88_03530 [Vicinamibacterales bacterium]